MGTLVLAGATSGSTTLTPVDAVTTVLTLPSSTATLATLGANTFAGNQSITGTLGVTGAATFNTGTFQAAEGAFTGVQVGTGGAGNQGWILGNASSNLSGIWSTGVTPSATNYSIRVDNGLNLYLNAADNVVTRIANVGVLNVASTGLAVTGTLGVTGVVSAPILRSTSPDPDDVSVATSTATTIFSASTYLIGRNGMLFSVMDDASIFGIGLVLKNANGALGVTTIFSQGSGFALSISSTNVQFTQTVGTTRTIKTRMWPSFSV